MESEPNVSGIEERLEKIVKLLALAALASETTVKGKALVLDRAGFAPREIADLVGSTPHAVSVALSEARKSTEKKAIKKRKVPVNGG